LILARSAASEGKKTLHVKRLQNTHIILSDRSGTTAKPSPQKRKKQNRFRTNEIEIPTYVNTDDFSHFDKLEI
jgi:hypothetical protein